MFGDVRARKCSKIGARTCSILEKIAFDTTLISTNFESEKTDTPKNVKEPLK